MPEHDVAAIQATMDYIAIRRAQDAYADIVSRRAWRELHEIFDPKVRLTIDLHDQKPIVLDGPDAIGSWIGTAIERFDFFQFVILGTRVFEHLDGDPDAAFARMYMSELRRERSSERFTIAYGLYQDNFKRIDGKWKFVARSYRTMARTAPDLNVFPMPHVEAWK